MDSRTYEVVPINKHQRRILETLAKDNQFDIWSNALKPKNVNVSIPAEIQHDFERVLADQGLYFKLIVQDIQAVVKDTGGNNTKKSCTFVDAHISFNKYYRYSEIQDYLKYLSINYPRTVEFGHYGMSYEKRNLSYVKISTGGNHHKPIIFIDAGIHAREWIAPAQALYIIHQLVENVENRYLINNVDWIIIPLANPDGYEYSHVKERFWRKNRAPGYTHNGVDPNRNFDIEWNTQGSSGSECSELYSGRGPFSEPETQALGNFILSRCDNIKLYLSFHSAAMSILYPFGFTNIPPANIGELHSLATHVQRTIEKVHGTTYTVCSILKRLKPMSGTSVDWAYITAGIDLAYMIELPAGGKRGFDMPSANIYGIVLEMFEGIRAFHDYVESH